MYFENISLINIQIIYLKKIEKNEWRSGRVLAQESFLRGSSPIAAKQYFYIIDIDVLGDPEREGVRVLVKNGLFTSSCIAHETSLSE